MGLLLYNNCTDQNAWNGQKWLAKMKIITADQEHHDGMACDGNNIFSITSKKLRIGFSQVESAGIANLPMKK